MAISVSLHGGVLSKVEGKKLGAIQSKYPKTTTNFGAQI